MRNNETTAHQLSKVAYVDNVQGATRDFSDKIIVAIKNGGKLPEELANLFTIIIVEVEDGIRGIINWS